jgi:hypothetical protein
MREFMPKKALASYRMFAMDPGLRGNGAAARFEAGFRLPVGFDCRIWGEPRALPGERDRRKALSNIAQAEFDRPFKPRPFHRRSREVSGVEPDLQGAADCLAGLSPGCAAR